MSGTPVNRGVDWARFTGMALLTAAAAIAGAFVLGLCRNSGYYEIRAVPVFGIVPAAGLAYLTVVVGRCRNHQVAGALGVLVVLVGYWGQFPASLALEAGPSALLSPRAIANYTTWRMSHEVLISFGETPQWPRGRIDPPINWVISVFMWFLLTAPLVALLVWRSRWFYCERCRRWTKRDVLKLPGKSAGKVLTFLEAGEGDRVNQTTLGTVDPRRTSPAYVKVEFCEHRRGNVERCPVFFTLFDGWYWQSGARTVAGQRVGVRGYVLQRVPLDDQQIKALSRTFPRLSDFVKTKDAERTVQAV